MSETTSGKQTVQYIEDPLSATEHCRYSLMCRHVCPVGHVTYRESLTPHGWALLIASVQRGMTEWNPETVDVLYQCADCGLCQSNCATSQPLPTAIAAARAEVVKKGLASQKVMQLDKALQKWANPYREETPREATEQGDLALYVGDAAEHVHPRTKEAALKLLKRAGIRPVIIGAGRSSGFLASSLGLKSTASKLAQAIMDEVEHSRCKKVLVFASGDLYAFTVLFKERLNLDWPEGVEVQQLTSLLQGLTDQGKLAFEDGETEQLYSYHDPCHSPRIPQHRRVSRELLLKVLKTKETPLFWRADRAHPCGAVGGLEWTQPELAAKLARARFSDVRRAGARLLITEDPLCLHHLGQHVSDGIQVKSLYEILVERMN